MFLVVEPTLNVDKIFMLYTQDNLMRNLTLI